MGGHGKQKHDHEYNKVAYQYREIYITHLKPGQADVTMGEIEAGLGARRPRMLEKGQVFEF